MGKAYGDTMGEYFGRRHLPAVESAALANDVALTWLQARSGTGMTAPIPAEPALLLAVQLQPLRQHRLWLDGKAVLVDPYQAGALTMLDLRSRPVADLVSGYECVQLYLPHAALDALSDVQETRRLDNLPLLEGADDLVLAHLARIARVAVNPSGPATSLFLDTLLLSVHSHLTQHYAGQARRGPQRGGLAPWQESRAKQYMEAHLDTRIGLMELAALCQLSPGYFGRAFKVSTGVTPHRWLITRRLARARHLMLRSELTLADIAQRCGFTDQSHMAREFRRTEGHGPAQWRRAQAS